MSVSSLPSSLLHRHASVHAPAHGNQFPRCANKVHQLSLGNVSTASRCRLNNLSATFVARDVQHRVAHMCETLTEEQFAEKLQVTPRWIGIAAVILMIRFLPSNEAE